MQLLQLPDVVLDTIFSYLTYDEVAKYRIVSRAWNEKCQDTLNRGFYAVEKYHSQCYKKYKALLPRRESERRTHVMARHCDILTAIETRLSMLSMTYTKFIDARLCCFIPGKVTDEIFRVLTSIEDMEQPPRAHEVLQELRDISSMAMEHFDENIVPGLRAIIAKKISCSEHIPSGRIRHLDLVTGNNTATPSSSTVPVSLHAVGSVHFTLPKFRSEILMRARAAGRVRKSVSGMRKLFKTFIYKVNKEHQQLNRKIRSQDEKIKGQDAQLVEMKRQLVEWDHKFNDLSAKLSRVPDMAEKEIGPSRVINSIKPTASEARNVVIPKKTAESETTDTVNRGTKRTRAATKADQEINQKKSRGK